MYIHWTKGTFTLSKVLLSVLLKVAWSNGGIYLPKNFAHSKPIFVQCVMLNNKLVAKVRTTPGKIGRRVGKTKTQKSNSELVNCSFSTSAFGGILHCLL